MGYPMISLNMKLMEYRKTYQDNKYITLKSNLKIDSKSMAFNQKMLPKF